MQAEGLKLAHSWPDLIRPPSLATCFRSDSYCKTCGNQFHLAWMYKESVVNAQEHYVHMWLCYLYPSQTIVCVHIVWYHCESLVDGTSPVKKTNKNKTKKNQKTNKKKPFNPNNSVMNHDGNAWWPLIGWPLCSSMMTFETPRGTEPVPAYPRLLIRGSQCW